MNIEFVDESGAVIASGSGPALAKALAGEAPLLTKPIVMVDESGKVTHAGFSGNPAGLVKSKAVADAVRAMPVPKAPMVKSMEQIRREIDRLPRFPKSAYAKPATKGQMRKAELQQGLLDVQEHRLNVAFGNRSVPANRQVDGPFAKAFRAGGRAVPEVAKYADYLLSIAPSAPNADFKSRCNQATRAAQW